MNIYHFISQLDELLAPEGFVMAGSDDPGLDGLQDNQAAWYVNDPDGHTLAVVDVNAQAVVVTKYNDEGTYLGRTAWPRPVGPQVVAASMVGEF